MANIIESGREDLNRYLNAMQLSLDFNLPFFTQAIEYYALWRGKKPLCLDQTFSKIMLNIAHSMVQDRIPKQTANMFASDDFITLEAEKPELELTRSGPEAWLRNMFKNPAKLNIISEIIPTLQSANIMGNGYRMPCVRHTPEGKRFITVRDIDYFQILLMPDGGLINPIDRYSEEAMSSFFHVDWMRRKQIEAMAKYDGFNADEAKKLFENVPDVNSTLDSKYRDIYSVIGGVVYGTKTDWRQRMVDVDGKDGRYRVVSWFGRDFWWIVAQDNFIIYKGKNPMGNGLLPLVNYQITPDLKNSHGIGAIEMTIDLVYAILTNFGFRMDYLLQLMNPTKYIRQDILSSKPKSEFLNRPGAIHGFPREIQDINRAFHVDRMPEISQQTFLEEDRMQRFLQNVSGFPDVSKGMVGPGEKGGATGIVTAIRQAGARVDAESLMLESSGVEQEGRLLLALAKDNVTEDEMVRDNNSANGFGWTVVDADSLTDQYIVHCKGTRFLSQKDETFKKLLALYPMWSQNPDVDQHELNMEIADAGDVSHRERIFKKPQQQSMNPAMGGGEAGGMASGQSLENRNRSVANRNTVSPNTGNTIPAGVAM